MSQGSRLLCHLNNEACQKQKLKLHNKLSVLVYVYVEVPLRSMRNAEESEQQNNGTFFRPFKSLIASRTMKQVGQQLSEEQYNNLDMDTDNYYSCVDAVLVQLPQRL